MLTMTGLVMPVTIVQANLNLKSATTALTMIVMAKPTVRTRETAGEIRLAPVELVEILRSAMMALTTTAMARPTARTKKTAARIRHVAKAVEILRSAMMALTTTAMARPTAR